MTSREKILEAVKVAQPADTALPPRVAEPIVFDDLIAQFSQAAKNGGSAVMEANSWEAICNHLSEVYLPALREKWQMHHDLRIVTTVPEMESIAERITNAEADPHTFQDVDLAIMSAQYGVAENSALWVPEQVVRVLPFICQHLVLVVEKAKLVSNMHEVYVRLGLGDEPYGVFIAGPSKTADIEQSLVLGAHGPRSLGVYLLAE